jgi:hypothetical protein
MMQYTSTSFTNRFRSTFGEVFRDQKVIEGDYHQPAYFAHTIRFVRRVVEPLETYLYAPVVSTARRVPKGARRIQSGNVSLYLLCLFAIFVIVLFAR